MKIIEVVGQEIFDSRGMPTVECNLTLEDGTIITASAPSGASRGKHEAFELRDGDNRLCGHGVSKAVNNLNTLIAPALVGNIPDVVMMDVAMLEIDGTDNKSKLGANAIIAASIAVIKAQAYAHNMHLYELIAELCGNQSVTLPFPMINVINGGVHADNNFAIQEIMLVPLGAQTIRSSLEASMTVFYHLKDILKSKGKLTLVGDEGGFAPHFSEDKEALDILMEAIHQAGYGSEGTFVLALDVAASQLYNSASRTYRWQGNQLTYDEMIEHYASLAQQYPLYSIEDGLSELDKEGWIALNKILGDRLQIVGDDLFVTNPERIAQGIEHHMANGAIIKPNQIGTVTETLQAINLCKENDINTIVSHRSGETNDTFIVDLAIGTSAGQLKAGGCSRGERMAKYNYLIECSEDLMFGSFDV